MAYKPDFVLGLPQWMTIHLPLLLPTGSSSLPGSAGAKASPTLRPRDPYSALLPAGLAMPDLLPDPRWALTPPFHPYPQFTGGLFSVALSLGLPRAGVTRRRCLLESGLSSHTRSHPAIREALNLSPSDRQGQRLHRDIFAPVH